MKIFELKWNKQDEREWIAADTNIEALRKYFSTTGTDWFDLDDEDEIIEIPESEWDEMTVTNTDFDASNEDDNWESMTFREFVAKNGKGIIAGTMYE